ncbi:hypothetical protein FRC16_006824 [Serendipita sp. 398]|nr:hypothetical protein FRC16_006824 [Serendipita sp. 398]
MNIQDASQYSLGPLTSLNRQFVANSGSLNHGLNSMASPSFWGLPMPNEALFLRLPTYLYLYSLSSPLLRSSFPTREPLHETHQLAHFSIEISTLITGIGTK